jgi:hypothetical protein
MSAASRLECRARRVSETFTHVRVCPSETGTHSREALIPADYGNLQHPRVVISNGHVRHVGQDARGPLTSPTFTTSPTTVITAMTTTTTPTKHSEATTATIKLKSPQVSLQLIHGLESYIRQMRSRAPT